MTRVIRLHFKPIYTPFLPHVLQLQCNNLPHEICNNLPQGGILLEVPVNQTPMDTRQ